MKVARRRPAPVFALGDFVAHAEQGTGVVDGVACVGVHHYFVSSWDGRGVRPLLFSVPRFVARGHELQAAQPPKLLVIRRR